MPQPLYLHIGLPKTGTTYVQRRLAANRLALKEHGFVYPFVRPEGMFHAAVEVRRQYDRWALPAERIDGTLTALLDRAAEVGGTAILSHELLGGASAEQVGAVLDATAGFDVRLVVTARDLARQVPAHWQEQVKNGQTYSFAEFERDLDDVGWSGRDDEFWMEQDLLSVLDRWATALPPEHVHLVVCPPPGSPSDLLWQRFCDAIGLDPATIEPESDDLANTSLGTAEVALLRAVNAQLFDQLDWTDYAHVVKRGYSQRELPDASSPAALTPLHLRPLLVERTQLWMRQLEERGYVLHGELAELEPTSFSENDPDDVPAAWVAERVPRVVDDLLSRVEVRHQDQQARAKERKGRRARLRKRRP